MWGCKFAKHAVLLAVALLATGCAHIAWTSMMAPSALAEAASRSHKTITFTVIDADTEEVSTLR